MTARWILSKEQQLICTLACWLFNAGLSENLDNHGGQTLLYIIPSSCTPAFIHCTDRIEKKHVHHIFSLNSCTEKNKWIKIHVPKTPQLSSCMKMFVLFFWGGLSRWKIGVLTSCLYWGSTGDVFTMPCISNMWGQVKSPSIQFLNWSPTFSQNSFNTFYWHTCT